MKIFSYWDGRDLGFLEYACIRSFISAGYQFELYSFNGLNRAPDGIEISGADKFLDRKEFQRVFSYNRRYSDVADLFRYYSIFQTGFMWVDLDVILKSKFDASREVIVGYQSLGKVNNAIMTLPKGGDVAEWLINSLLSRDLFIKSRGETGPNLLTEAIAKFGFLDQVYSRNVFYPIHFSNIHRITESNSYDFIDNRLKNSTAVHLWSEILSKELCCWPHLRETNSWLSLTLLGYLNDGEFEEVCDRQQVSNISNRKTNFKKVVLKGKKFPGKISSILKFFIIGYSRTIQSRRRKRNLRKKVS